MRTVVIISIIVVATTTVFASSRHYLAVSDVKTRIVEHANRPANKLHAINRSWTADLNGLTNESQAYWIWGDSEALHFNQAETYTFERMVVWKDKPVSATLIVASDNHHKVLFNNVIVGSSPRHESFQKGSEQTYRLRVHKGKNILRITVTNDGGWGSAASNPAGLLYALYIEELADQQLNVQPDESKPNGIPSTPSRGHYYERIEFTGTWAEAKAEADSRTYRGLKGHLVTITTSEEDNIVHALGNVDGFAFGGWQDHNSATYSEPRGGWQWVTGEPWNYDHWAPAEPNNGYVAPESISPTPGAPKAITGPDIRGEDHLVGFYGNYWNDGWLVRGYVVEYEP